MAGKADQSTGQTGPTPRRPAAGRPRPTTGRPVFTPAPVEISAAAPEQVDPGTAALPTVTELPPDIVPRMLQTQASYRRLIANGFSPADAAGLVGYVVGLPPAETRWSISQVNRLLFLRSLYADTSWGKAERQPAR
jgi:hypothetical protein